ncbi:MAG TPA: hypothetical protein VIM34_13835 [Burkholderiaceae bacterium]
MSSCRAEILAGIRTLQTHNGGDPVSPEEVINEMVRTGTAYPERTIRTDIVSRMCVNPPQHQATIWPDLRRVGWGLYVLAGRRAGTMEG